MRGGCQTAGRCPRAEVLCPVGGRRQYVEYLGVQVGAGTLGEERLGACLLCALTKLRACRWPRGWKPSVG